MSDLSELYDKYFAFMIDQCDKRSNSAGFSMMYDVTDAGLSNVEMVSCAERERETDRQTSNKQTRARSDSLNSNPPYTHTLIISPNLQIIHSQL